MTITHAHILNIGSSSYDLRKAISWNPDPNDPTYLLVKFQDLPEAPARILLTTFETAKNASLAASGG